MMAGWVTSAVPRVLAVVVTVVVVVGTVGAAGAAGETGVGVDLPVAEDTPVSTGPAAGIDESDTRLRAATLAAGIVADTADAAIPTDAGQLPSLLAAQDPAAYVRELDRLLFEDLIHDISSAERPDPPYWELELLQRSLAPTSVLLAFHPVDEVVWAVAISSDEVVPRRLKAPHTTALGPRLVHWAEAPSERALDRHAASAIHNNLLLPFIPELAGKRHVIVAASGVLRDLPFEVLLMTPAPDDAPVTEMAFLIRRFEFAYEPTVGSRLGWSGRPGDLRRVRRAAVDEADTRVVVAGTLMAMAGSGPYGRGVEALGWLREGASGCLLGGDESTMDTFLRRFYRERSGGRRPNLRAVHRARIGLLSDGEPPHLWAWPMLYGAD